MAYLAVDKNGTECVYDNLPYRYSKEMDVEWYIDIEYTYCILPKGSIFKLTGKSLTWDDEPVEIMDE